ncbi:MAG: glycosyltransferase family 39 protein [Candidatus Krumholzibacteriia bacterium]
MSRAAPPPAPLPPSRPPRRLPAPVALAAIVLASLALRAWRLRQGLPDFLDEAIPFKQALGMWGWETGRPDFNPHFFNYPTFAIYLQFAVQKLVYAVGALTGRFANPNDFRLLVDTDPTVPVIAARLLGFAADAVSVALAWRLGERLRRGAGPAAALLVAFSPVLIATAREIHVDSVMTALVAAAVERLLAWRQEGGRLRLATAVALIGLAAGAKYTAGGLVLPLGWVLWERAGGRGLRRWPLLAAAALGVFLLSSPWVALDFHRFWTDFWSERLHMSEGHLGVQGRTGALYYMKGLWSDPGPAAVLLLLSSLFRLRRAGPSRGAAVTVWLALLPLLAGLISFRMEADRYLAPVVLLAAPLAAAAALEAAAGAAARRWPRGASPRATRALTGVVLALLLLPALAGGLRVARSGRDSTQQQARRWCEARLGGGELLLQEAFGATLLTPFDVERVRRTRYFAGASGAARARFLARRTWHAATLPMAASGRLEVAFARDNAPPLRLTVFPHATDFNQTFYDPALLDGVDYLLVSGAVRRRYAADPARYPAQNALYARLAATAAEAARFAPGHGVVGPEIVIYRLGEPFWRELRAHDPPLDLFWWARFVPPAYRRAAEAALVAPDQQSGGAFRRPASGLTAGWVLSLRHPFDQYVLPFAVPLGVFLADRGQFAPARRQAAGVLAVAPDVGPAALLFSLCAERQGDPAAARAMLETTLRNQQREGLDTADVRRELARLQAAAPAPAAPADTGGSAVAR